MPREANGSPSASCAALNPAFSTTVIFSRLIFPSVLIGLLAAFLLQVQPFTPAQPYRLRVPLRSDSAGRAQLLWRSAHGTVQPVSATVPVIKGGQMLTFDLPDTAPGTFRLRNPPQDAIDAFRLNPIDREGQIEIGEIKLLGTHDETLAVFPPSALRPSNRALALKVQDGTATFTTQPGEGVFIAPKSPLALTRIMIPFQPGTAAVQFGIAALATLFVLILASFVPAAARARFTGALAKIRDDQAAWPAATLLVVAAFATALSCYPIIFCGKSFVSPDYGPTQALYEEFPTLPQSPHESTESSRGSDTGALLWAHLPYSVIQHRAIFEHGELPLWNRYTFCGGPLLGQGQSMLGDPLHWIPIAAGGAVWAWDVKFCIAKLLFSFGVGLLAFAVTKRIWLAALLAISSSFLGFFAYRFNHCAFFSLCYSPWILLCWLRAAHTGGRVWPWALALAAANFWELNSGTAKESAMLIAGLNLTGVLLILNAEGGWRRRLGRLALMSFGNVIFVMLSAPHWLVFLDALRQAWTSSSHVAFQIQPGIALGLFDDLFYSQTISNESLFNPGANFLVLLGCLCAAVDLRRLLRDRTFTAVLLGAALQAAIVFGIVPPGFIAGLPFLGSIQHVDDVFSCVLIMHLLVLAAFGLRSLWDRAAEKTAPGDAAVMTFLFAILIAAFFGYAQASHRTGPSLLHAGETMKMSGFFLGYALALSAAILAMPWVVRSLRLRPSAGSVLLGMLLIFLFHFRHGLWTGTKFDSYVANPRARSELDAPSPAVEAVRATIARGGEPSRVAGIGGVLVPGFNTVLGLEHFNGADALISRWQRELEEKSGIPIEWLWRCVVPREAFPGAQIFGDLWNTRWYLGTPSELPREVNGLAPLKTLDLGIYTSRTAWPRAFFTDRLADCSSLENFVTLLRTGDRRPFAALVPEKVSDAPSANVESIADRIVLPATEYRLTENSTSFTINAPTPGVAVLGNSFESGNWRVTLDGRRVDCFRVNHAFLGVALPEAGVHRLRFSYWPRMLTPALWISLGGLLLVAGTIFIGIRMRPSEAGEPGKDPQEAAAGTTGA